MKSELYFKKTKKSMLTTFHVSGLIFVPKFSGKEKKKDFYSYFRQNLTP